MKKNLCVGLFFLWALSTTTVVGAAASEPTPLTPYTATYSTTAMGMKVRIKRQLMATDDGYMLTSNGSSMFAKIKESARFKVIGEQIQGIDYSYHLKSVVRRQREVIFLPENGIIKSLKKGDWTEHAWSAGVLDQLSQQEQLRLDLKIAAQASDAPPEILEFRVVDGPRIKQRTLKFLGTETLTTSIGDVETFHYEQVRSPEASRRSNVWIAPSLDYLMVRTRHEEDNSTIEILLESLALETQESSR